MVEHDKVLECHAATSAIDTHGNDDSLPTSALHDHSLTIAAKRTFTASEGFSPPTLSR